MSEQLIKTNIAIRLLQFRHENNLTQKQIAALLKISQATYAKIELHQREPRVKLLITIAELLDISIEELVSIPNCHIRVSLASLHETVV